MTTLRLFVGGAALIAAPFLFSAPADARNFRVSQVPNNVFSCLGCHVGGNGGSRNAFGASTQESLTTPGANGDVRWELIYDEDSDNDGFTNGEELGDPEGLWRPGMVDPRPETPVTNPGDPNDFPRDPDACGNGVIDPGETCDGENLNGESCTSRGFDAGQLTCSNCTFDTGQCSECGDGRLDVGELCDGGEFDGATCESEGFDGGELICSGACQVETSACTVCGNGILEETEACDGEDLGGQDCASRGFIGGELGCLACAFEESGCVPDPGNTCGDGRRLNGEACDQDDLGGQSCVSLGFVDGELACTDECVLETGGCQSCGNGLIDEGEACDGENFGGLDCLSLGLGEGALVCNSDCTRDDSACADPAFDGENNGLEDPPDAVEPGQGAAAQQGCSAAPGRAGPAAVVAWGLVFLVAFRRRRRSAPPA